MTKNKQLESYNVISASLESFLLLIQNHKQLVTSKVQIYNGKDKNNIDMTGLGKHEENFWTKDSDL